MPIFLSLVLGLRALPFLSSTKSFRAFSSEGLIKFASLYCCLSFFLLRVLPVCLLFVPLCFSSSLSLFSAGTCNRIRQRPRPVRGGGGGLGGMVMAVLDKTKIDTPISL